MNYFFESIKLVLFNFLNNLYYKGQICCIKTEDKILRNLKDSLSYIIRDNYNKNIIGVNILVDKVINSVTNILLLIPEDITHLTKNEKSEVIQIISDIKTNENVEEIISLRLQLKALKCLRNSKNVYNNEVEKNHYMDEFNETMVNLRLLKAPLHFDPTRPKYGKLKSYSAKLLKKYTMIVTIKNLNTSNSTLKTIYGSIGKIISVILMLIIICSSLYEFGYSYKIGVSLNKIPVDYFDIIFSSFEWLPLIFFAILIFFTREFYISRFDHCINSLQKREEQFYYLYFSIFVASIMLSHLSMKFIIIWYVALFFVSIFWIRFISWIYFHPQIAINMPLYIKYVLSYAILLLVIFFVNGYLRASEDLISNDNLTTIELTNEKTLYNVRLLRNFRNGLLYIYDNKLYFVPNSQVRNLYLKKIK